MFKRAVITDEISQDFARAADIAVRYGLDGVELRSAWDKNPHEWEDPEVRLIKKTVQATGLQVPCIAAPVFKCKLNQEAEYQEHLEILRRSIRLAHEVGANLIRGFTFWDEGNFDQNLPQICDKIAAIEPILRENGMTLVIEYDPATSANSSQKLEQVLAQVASKHIRALWDPGNNLYVTDAERPFPEGYQRLKPYLAHIHVKDISRDPNTGLPDACPLGRGEVGFAAVFKQLAADGYQGWLSLETHYRKRGPLSEELLALPKGSSFSLGGEEASTESLELWNEMLRLEGLDR